MKKIIHTIGYVDDNDDIVIMGSVHTDKTEKIIRFTLVEEVTAQLLESNREVPSDFFGGIFGENGR